MREVLGVYKISNNVKWEGKKNGGERRREEEEREESGCYEVRYSHELVDLGSVL